MKNLAAIVTPEAIVSALTDAYDEKVDLHPSTKYHVLHKGRGFPPKEIVRLAAKKMGIVDLDNYRLNGGKSTNRHFEKKGFEIIKHSDWQFAQARQTVASIETKITRLTFNTNGWTSPSGPEGKSKTPGLHEYEYGFGHEEWLFDFSKKIKGLKYGFIEGLRTKNNKHGGQVYNLQLFTIDNLSKEKYWIGTIRSCYVLNRIEKLEIQKEFIKRGWIGDMKEQLQASGLWKTDTNISFDTFGPNVCFKEEDVALFDTPNAVEHNDYIDNRDRYLLYDWDDVATIEIDETGFKFTPSKPQDKRKVLRTRVPEFQSKEIKQLHREIAASLYKELSKKYGVNNVGCDIPNTHGTFIDMVRKVGKEYIFYEIKTYNQLRKNIREALGQLLEYAYWDRGKKVRQIVIVSDKPLDTTASKYLNFLSSELNIRVAYLHQPV